MAHSLSALLLAVSWSSRPVKSFIRWRKPEGRDLADEEDEEEDDYDDEEEFEDEYEEEGDGEDYDVDIEVNNVDANASEIYERESL
jgi:hypothetical protein